MKALIDATIHDTPIGQCVVVPPLSADGPVFVDGSTPGAWKHCTPAFIRSGGNCSSTPRRACRCDGLDGSQHDCGHDHLHLSAGDVLAVVETCPVVNDDGSHPVEHDDAVCWHCNGTGHIRRGFVRVREVLPVVEAYTVTGMNRVCAHLERSATPSLVEHAQVVRPGEVRLTPIDLPASPGDVVLVVEPWCKICGGSGRTHEWLDIDDDKYYKATFPCINCKSTSVTIMHRDGVLGEVGDLQ